MLRSLIESLGLLSLIGLLLHSSSGYPLPNFKFLISRPFHSANTPYECNMAVAEDCFTQLFDNMPICSASEESAELAFRCVHYNVRLHLPLYVLYPNITCSKYM